MEARRSEPMTQKQRRIANFLLQPVVQLRVGLYNVILSIGYVLLLGAFAYWRLGEFTEVVVTLTEADQEVLALLDDYMRRLAVTALVSGILFVLVNIAVSVWLTHRLVGPTVAFRRHIKGLIAG